MTSFFLLSLLLGRVTLKRIYNINCIVLMNNYVLPSGSVVKNPPFNAGDPGLIPGLRRSPGGGKGNPLQYSFLENTMDREV